MAIVIGVEKLHLLKPMPTFSIVECGDGFSSLQFFSSAVNVPLFVK